MSRRLTVFLVCLFSLVTSCATGADNLIRNSGFENIDKEGYLQYFSKGPKYSAGVDAALNIFEPSAEAHSGVYSAKFTAKTGGFITQRNIQLKGGKPYRFSLWVKTDIAPAPPSKYTPGAMVHLYPTLPVGWGTSWPKVGAKLVGGDGRHDWRKLETCFRADKKWNNLWLAIYVIGASGTAWYDDFELVECSEGEFARFEELKKSRKKNLGENLMHSGSFEITTNKDWPDFVYTSIGVAWFDTPWKGAYKLMHDKPPHGRNYLRTRRGTSFQNITIDPEAKDIVLSFYARAKPAPVKVSVGFVEWKTIEVGEQWKRYVVHMQNKKKKKKIRVMIHAKSKKTEIFDLDGVKVEYGKSATKYSLSAYERFHRDALAAMDEPAMVEAGKPVTCPVTAEGPKIDGTIEKSAWRPAVKLGALKLADGSAPTQKTFVYIMRDETNLYVAFRAVEKHMKSLLARETRSDRLAHLDDCVGIAVQPWPERRNSLAKRFFVSAAGVKSEGRGLRWWWDAPWKAKVHRSQKGWSVEMAIPLAALCEGITPDGKWGINFFRQRPASGVRKTENSLFAGSRQRDLAPIMMNLDKSAGAGNVRLGSTRFVWDSPDKKSVMWRVPAMGAVGLSWMFEARVGDKILVSRGQARENGKLVGFSVPAEMLRKAKDGYMTARDGDHGPLRAFRFLPMIELPAVIELMPPKWNYTFVGKPNMVRARIGVSPEKAKDLFVEFVVSRKGANVVSKKVPAEKALEGIQLDEKLASGEYVLSASLVDGAGKKYKAENTYPFRKLPEKNISIRINQWKRMLVVDGKPFIPFVFSISHATKFIPRFPELKKAGFNTLFVWGTEGWSPKNDAPKVNHERMRELLDAAHKQGLRVILTARTKIATKLTDMTLDDVIELHTSWGKLYANHPAMLMWHHMDEVYASWAKGEHKKKEEDLVTLYRRCVEADPYRPHYNNSAYVGRIYGGPDSTDLISCTSYTTKDLGGAAGTVNFARGHKRAIDRDKRTHMATIWMQFYTREQREPTPAEINAMVYGCLIYDVRQFKFWTMRCSSNDLWNSMPKVGGEIKELTPILYRAKPVDGIRVTHPGVKTAAFLDGKDLYIVAVNLELVPVRARFDPGLLEAVDGSVKVMFDNRSIKTNASGDFEDVIEANGRRVFVIRLK